MASIRIPGSKAGAAVLKMTRRFAPVLEEELVGESARVAYQAIMDTQRVDTNTLLSSTNVSVGKAVGRGLTYGPGNTPLPITIVDQGLLARELGEPLVISEDAKSPEGFPYGVVVEAKYGTFGNAQGAVVAAAPAIATKAVAKAIKRALS